ncbi:ABC transporter permease [Paenibacillus pasadenensis]|uniref:Putative hemin transport system permease protein HrtB n=1 Tax=Paenibacillus pasadenensis TaxID=217090 RepID=A0A2N5N076_9BACL|nr:ABC transporter permease [Paenibacillus pasadenensis]PLT43712.1 ABC-type antimicrobial peptide transport system, permease component [Paenibacillus pasadenensis]
MSLFSMAWRGLMARRAQTLITAAVVMIGLSVTLAVLLLSSGARQGIERASEPFGLLIGSKGSANQLVFNTIFLMDKPLANLSYAYYERLAADPEIRTAVPFALGDQYRGRRLVGTTPAFFGLSARPADPPYFKLREGRLFDQPFEAVVGAEVAARDGLRIGDTFVSEHGVAASAEPDEHGEHPYTVVGILERLHAPSDQGIYVSMESYWQSHDHGADEAAAGGEAHVVENAVGGGEAHADESPEDEAAHGVTAILVKPNSYIGLMKLYQQTNAGEEAQAVLPGQTLAMLFDMMGSGEQALRGIGWVLLGMAGLTVCLSLYSSAVERRRSVAILRSLGAGRRQVMAIVLLESALMTGLGCALGVLGAYGLAAALAGYARSHVSIALPLGFDWSSIGLAALVLAAGIVSGLAPAIGAYRTETARHLSPS